MKLGMFYWPCGHHIAAWRHPDSFADSGENLPHLIELAQLAERGLFDMFFMADAMSFWRGPLEASFTPKEMGELNDLDNCVALVNPAHLPDESVDDESAVRAAIGVGAVIRDRK